jgi:dUTP pyrophosphatase
MNDLRIYFKRLSKKAKVPKYSKNGDACCDLSVIEDYLIRPGETRLARTGFAIAIPEGFEAQIRPRSGLVLKKGLSIPNSPATIDSGYRGEIKIPLINLGRKAITIRKGDRVAQMKFAIVYTGNFLDVGDNKLEDTERGSDGFGSTGF